jgi:putative phosphoribosyl transferase
VKFKDRIDAGRQLAGKLKAYCGQPYILVLALPPGGVPVAAEIAAALNAAIDVFLMRKLGVPGLQNLAMGAITTGETRVLNADVVNYLGIPAETIEAVARLEQRELERQERLYRGNQPAPVVTGKTVILVDDGMASGTTIQTALYALSQQRPLRLIVALPILARTTLEAIDRLSEEIICVGSQPAEPPFSDGIWYEDFRQTTEAEARRMLSASIVGSSR